MAVSTVLDVLTMACLGIRVHRLGASLPPEMAQHALDALNMLLETWTVDRRRLYRVREVVVPLTMASSYTVGPGGQVNVPFLPVAIQPGFTRLGGMDYPYDPMTREVYHTCISWKDQGGTVPSAIYYERQTPLGSIHPWPVSGGELHLMVDQPLGPLVVNDTLSFPDGYKNALTLALGKYLAPTYGQTLDPVYLDNLQQAESALRKRNYEPAIATVILPTGYHGHDPTYIIHGGH